MPDKSKTLRELLDEFESIVEWFDGDNLDVEKAIKQFEKGSELAEQIKKQLVEAKNKVEIIKKKFD